MGWTRDEIAEALRLHRSEIIEADEWRPIASHVYEIIKLAEIKALEWSANLCERVKDSWSGYRAMDIRKEIERKKNE